MISEKLAIHEQYVREGWLTKSEYKNLVLYNYTQATTYAKKWDEITRNSRGTIYDKVSGEVYARSFSKFFNIDEMPETQLDRLPLNSTYFSAEKMDGSLIISFQDPETNEWMCATRGSFYSDQAKKATELIKNLNMPKIKNFCKTGASFLFEVIYPENRIVIDYGKEEKLVLLALLNKNTGKALAPRYVYEIAKDIGVETPPIYHSPIEDLIKDARNLPWQEEGFVVYFDTGLMVKIKGADYCRIAKIKSHLGPLSVWEAMMTGYPENYLKTIPEEIKAEADRIYDILQRQLLTLKLEALTQVQFLNLYNVNLSDKEVVKKKALQISQAKPHLRSFLFAVMRKVPREKCDLLLTEYLRPKNNEYVKIGDL